MARAGLYGPDLPYLSIHRRHLLPLLLCQAEKSGTQQQPDSPEDIQKSFPARASRTALQWNSIRFHIIQYPFL